MSRSLAARCGILAVLTAMGTAVCAAAGDDATDRASLLLVNGERVGVLGPVTRSGALLVFRLPGGQLVSLRESLVLEVRALQPEEPSSSPPSPREPVLFTNRDLSAVPKGVVWGTFPPWWQEEERAAWLPSSGTRRSRSHGAVTTSAPSRPSSRAYRGIPRDRSDEVERSVNCINHINQINRQWSGRWDRCPCCKHRH